MAGGQRKSKTKRHDYKSGEKFRMKHKKTVSKGKRPIGAEPKKIIINTGSMFKEQHTNVAALGVDAVKMPNTKRPKNYRKVRKGAA